MRVALLFSLICFTLGYAGELPAFLGPIPVQYVSVETPLTIDMHRFYQPTANSQLETAKVDGAEVTFEPGNFQLTAKATRPGIFDLPISVASSSGKLHTVLTLAAGSHENAPTIFADKLANNVLTIRAVGKITKISAVFERPNESEIVVGKIDGDTAEINLPKSNGVLRAIAADESGTTSNTIIVERGKPARFEWHDAIMYYALTDRFFDGDKSNDKPVNDAHVLPPANYHGGDLRGIKDKIDAGYFDSLGINTVWLGPLNRNPAIAYQESPEPHRWYTGYHGYWPISPTEIDPHLGTAKDLHALVAAAHAHNMHVIADLVLHHVHLEHPWWKAHRDWFGKLDLPDGRKNLRLWDEQQFTTWFEPFMPSFNFANPAAVRALIDNTVWWANEYKLDGFRLDAVKHIVPNFWWKFRSALRERVEKPRGAPLYLVGETFKDRSGIMSFVGPNMLDGQFDFPLYDEIKNAFGLTTSGLAKLDDSLGDSERAFGKETLMSPLIGNHDKGRFMAYADGELPDANSAKDEEVGWKNPPAVRETKSFLKLELAQAFLLAIDGVPMLYYGDEIGMTGAGDPDNRRDMRFGNQVSANEQGVLENIRKLTKIRNAHPALRYGSRRELIANENSYAFVRAQLEDRVVFIANRGDAPAQLKLNVAPELADGDYVDSLGGTNLKVTDGTLTLEVPARRAVFVTRK